ncbi:MAG: cation diffusion facilitator family transporter [Smithellaceae bacterium]
MKNSTALSEDVATLRESYRRKELLLLKAATAATVVYAAVAVIIALISDSMTLLLDGAYSVIDMLVSFAAILVVRKLQEPPNERYHFGYAKFEPLMTAADGLLLLFLCFMSIFVALQDLMHPDPVEHVGVILVFTATSVFLCLGMGLYMRYAGEKWHSEILVTDSKLWLMEGVVSLGVCISFSIGWIMRKSPGWENYTSYSDPLTCIAIALFFIVSPFKILKNSVRDLTDACPPRETMNRISLLTQYCCEKHELAAVELLRLRKSGRRLYLDANFETQQNHDIKTIDEIRNQISAYLRTEVPDLDIRLGFANKKTAVCGALNSPASDGADGAQAVKGTDL